MWKYDDVTELHVSNHTFAFQRGPFVVVITNIGSEYQTLLASRVGLGDVGRALRPWAT